MTRACTVGARVWKASDRVCKKKANTGDVRNAKPSSRTGCSIRAWKKDREDEAMLSREGSRCGASFAALVMMGSMYCTEPVMAGEYEDLLAKSGPVSVESFTGAEKPSKAPKTKTAKEIKAKEESAKPSKKKTTSSSKPSVQPKVPTSPSVETQAPAKAKVDKAAEKAKAAELKAKAAEEREKARKEKQAAAMEKKKAKRSAIDAEIRAMSTEAPPTKVVAEPVPSPAPKKATTTKSVAKVKPAPVQKETPSKPSPKKAAPKPQAAPKKKPATAKKAVAKKSVAKAKVAKRKKGAPGWFLVAGILTVLAGIIATQENQEKQPTSTKPVEAPKDPEGSSKEE